LDLSDIPDVYLDHAELDENAIELDSDIEGDGHGRWWHLKHQRTVVKYRRWARRNVVWLILITNVVMMLLLSLLSPSKVATVSVENELESSWPEYLCIGVNVLQVLLLFGVSFKFVRKSHRMTLSYLVEVYFSIIIIFASIQMSSLMGNTKAWKLAWVYDPPTNTYYDDGHREGRFANHTYEKLALQDQTDVFWMTYIECVYVSTIIMTTAGFGDAYPTAPSSRCFCILHMLCSVFYMTVIASVGLSKRHQVARQIAGNLPGRESLLRNGLAALLTPRSRRDSSSCPASPATVGSGEHNQHPEHLEDDVAVTPRAGGWGRASREGQAVSFSLDVTLSPR